MEHIATDTDASDYLFDYSLIKRDSFHSTTMNMVRLVLQHEKNIKTKIGFSIMLLSVCCLSQLNGSRTADLQIS